MQYRTLRIPEAVIPHGPLPQNSPRLKLRGSSPAETSPAAKDRVMESQNGTLGSFLCRSRTPPSCVLFIFNQCLSKLTFLHFPPGFAGSFMLGSQKLSASETGFHPHLNCTHVLSLLWNPHQTTFVAKDFHCWEIVYVSLFITFIGRSSYHRVTVWLIAIKIYLYVYN